MNHQRSWVTKADAGQAVYEWIEEFYNPQRRHSETGLVSPVEHELRFISRVELAAGQGQKRFPGRSETGPLSNHAVNQVWHVLNLRSTDDEMLNGIMLETREGTMAAKDNAKNALTIAMLDDVFGAASALAAQYMAKPEEYPEVDATTATILIKAYHQEGWFHSARRKATFLSVRGGGNESSNVVAELESKGRLWAENSRKAVNASVLKDGLEAAADRVASLVKTRFPDTPSVSTLADSLMATFNDAQKALIQVGARRLGTTPPDDWATAEGYDAHPLLRVALGERSRGDFEARKRRLALLHRLIEAVCCTTKAKRKNQLYGLAVAWANERA